MFGDSFNYAQLVKIYRKPLGGGCRYSPPDCMGDIPNAIYGDPNPRHIRMSSAERSNLTMGIQMCRFTWWTNALSKKVENHAHAVTRHMMY